MSSVQYNCKDPIEPIDVRGWIFKGWWTKDENDEYVEEITHCPVTDEQEIDLYAKQDLEQYKDVFILNGGTFEGTTPNETHEYNPSSSPATNAEYQKRHTVYDRILALEKNAVQVDAWLDSIKNIYHTGCGKNTGTGNIFDIINYLGNYTWDDSSKNYYGRFGVFNEEIYSPS